MNKYLQLFRMGNALIAMVALVIASFMAVGTALPEHWMNLIIGAAVVFLFVAGGNSLNDYIDVDIDRTAHPERPVPSGKLTPIQARNIGIIMLAGSVIVSFLTMDLAVVVVVTVAAILMVCYEMAFKQRGFIGNVTIAILTGLVFVLAGAIVGDWTANLACGSMAALVSVGREITKDIEDMDSDIGRKTLPMKIGVRNASIVASVFFIAGPILSWAPFFWGSYNFLYYTVIVADVIFFYCAYIVFSDKHKAQKTAKIGMLAGLLAFILGVLPI